MYGLIEKEYPKRLERWQQKREADKAVSTREDHEHPEPIRMFLLWVQVAVQVCNAF